MMLNCVLFFLHFFLIMMVLLLQTVLIYQMYILAVLFYSASHSYTLFRSFFGSTHVEKMVNKSPKLRSRQCLTL